MIKLFNKALTLNRYFNIKNQVYNSKINLTLNNPKGENAANTFNRFLHQNLKSLELIEFIEMNYTNKQLENLSLDFLLELQSIKYNAQLNTIQLAKKISS